jgi:hypothetical protein
MTTQRYILIAIAVILAVVASLAGISQYKQGQRQNAESAMEPRVGEPLRVALQTTVPVQAWTSGAVVTQPLAVPTLPPVVTQPVPPAEMADWYSMTESKRLDLATELQHNPKLSPDVVAFLRTVIQDRQRGIVTRNNAANALVGHEMKDPGLAAVFKRMVEDPSEDEQWRNYALQFLAVSVDWSDDPQAMTNTLWKMATEGPGSIPGTALLHLHYIDQRGVAVLPPGYTTFLAKILAQDHADLPSRMTVAGIAGQRGMTELAPQLRNLAENAPQPALRRTALAALGQIADPADLAFIKRFIKDSDPLIAAAAKGAERNLLAGNQKTPPTIP